MNVLIAIDSFKGSLSSLGAGNAAAEGIRRVYPGAKITVLPVADGGEGTVDALTEGLGGEKVSVIASDPLGRRIKCEYGIVRGDTAVIEMSASSGITLLKKEELNPMKTTSYGVGEMIKDAAEKGCRNFIVGIGGSATNDGGAGMLQALGFELCDKEGKHIPYGAEGLRYLDSISDKNVPEAIRECTFNIACDVNNPLCGERGCSAVFGPQKGADEKAVKEMDALLSDFAVKAKQIYPSADADASGAGAAGGLGFAFMTFLGGKLTSGIELILNEINIEEKIREADIVITGEGRIDRQTLMGKAPGGVALRAKKYGKTVIGLAGGVTKDAVYCNEKGIDAFFPIVRGVTSLSDALREENACENMKDSAEQVFRLIKTVR